MHDRTIDFIKNFKKINLPLNGVRLPTFKIENKTRGVIGYTSSLQDGTIGYYGYAILLA